MRKSGNKVLIIVLIVIAVLAIVGGVFAYLFLATDVFKSNQQLFAKYLIQNMNGLETIGRFSALEQIEEQVKQNKYEENITISCSQEGGEELIGQLTIDTQNDPVNKKNYGIIGLLIDGFDKTLEVEYMKENDMYSLRFTNSVKQFLSFENNNLKQFARNLGMDEETISQIPDKIDFEEFSLETIKLTEDEKQTELNKYLNLLYNSITKEKYTKTKNAVITVNGNTITTDAYTLTLNMQDLKNLGIALLEALKQDEIILSKLQMLDEKLQEYSEEKSIKDSFVELIQLGIDELNNQKVTEETITITVYQQGKNTVRIKLEQGLNDITLDTTTVEGKQQIDLKFTSIDEENTQLSYGITFVKENDNNLTIKFFAIDGEEQQEATITAEVVQGENSVKLNVALESEYLQTEITREVTFMDEINYAVTLDNSNNIVLNELTAEKIDNIMDAVSSRVVIDYIEPFEPLMQMLIENSAAGSIDNAEMQLFNSGFEAYEGVGKTGEEVNELIGIVVDNNSMELYPERKIEITGDVILDTETNSVIQAVKNKYYSIECKKDSDGWINEIVILEQEIQANIEPRSYTEMNNVSVEKTAVSPDVFQPSTITPSEGLANTGDKIISLLRTIGTIAIVIMLVW